VQLDKRGGENELWVALETLYEFAASLGEAPCEIVLATEDENTQRDGLPTGKASVPKGG
jgi:hypothetical protein